MGVDEGVCRLVGGGWDSVRCGHDVVGKAGWGGA